MPVHHELIVRGRPRPRPDRGALLLLTLLLPALHGCAPRSPLSGGRGVAQVAPVLSVERFLQAANAQDLDAMARLFGTADGPMIETGGTLGCAFRKIGDWLGIGDRCLTLAEVEVRMFTIAQLLTHTDYRVVSERTVPGRSNPTTRIGVNLIQGGRVISDVPFVVVRSGEGRWLVEEVGLERITGE